MTNQLINIETTINDALERALKARGVANVLIAGKTGVGKSTLINAIFQKKMAETGQGEPVTQFIRKITKEGVPVNIYDTKELEIKDYQPILDELLNVVKKVRKSNDPLEHIHVAWICIAEGSRRVEKAEKDLAKALSEHMPVIIVITTAISDQGFRAIVREQFPFARNVIRVNSVALPLEGGNMLLQHGLENLVGATMEVIPEGQKKAFAAAQRIKISEKVDQSHKIVATAAIAAGGVGAVPIPFADAVAIVPIQVSMLAGISAAFGLDINKAFLSTLVSSTITASGATIAGRAAVGSLLKLIPGIGSAAGAMISTAVAMSLTTAFGEAYIATLYAILKNSPDRQPTVKEISDAFKSELDRKSQEKSKV